MVWIIQVRRARPALPASLEPPASLATPAHVACRDSLACVARLAAQALWASVARPGTSVSRELEALLGREEQLELQDPRATPDNQVIVD